MSQGHFMSIPAPERWTFPAAKVRVEAGLNTLQALGERTIFDSEVLETVAEVGRDLLWIDGIEIVHEDGERGLFLGRTPREFDDLYFGDARNFDTLVQRMVGAETAEQRETVLDELPGVLELHSDMLERARGVAYDGDFIDALDRMVVRMRTAINTFRLWRKASTAVARVETAAELAEEAADAAAESAGETAAVTLSGEFDALAATESRSGNIFRGLTIAFLLGAVVYSAVIAFVAKTPSVELAQKLAVTVPILLLAGYFTREASHHRRTSQWASVLGAQLRSLRAYTAALKPEQAADLRYDLGRRVFLTSPESGEASPGADGATLDLIAERLSPRGPAAS